MGRDLAEQFSAASAVFDRVSKATGQDARRICWHLSEDELRQTENAQLALFTAGVAAYEALVSEGIEADVFAGHSVGEYAALVAAGILTVEDGAKLVRHRGLVMADAGRKQPGTMAAIVGLEREVLESICSSTFGIVAVANDNCPGQLVISGEIAAVESAGALAKEAGAKLVVRLNVSGAFHSPLMEEPAKSMRPVLDRATFSSAGTVVSNVTARVVEDPFEWPQLLEEQLRKPVRWTESMQTVLAMDDASFVECGGGDVLSKLMKRIDKTAPTAQIQDSESLGRFVEEN